MPTIEVAENATLDAVRALYGTCGYGGGVRPEDHVVVARHHADLIGAARLCLESGLLVLRGMQVHPERRRRGVGAAMLTRLEEAMAGTPCWCLPYRHLEAFYGRAGFVTVRPDSAPAFLRHRLTAYLARGADVILMHRPG